MPRSLLTTVACVTVTLGLEWGAGVSGVAAPKVGSSLALGRQATAERDVGAQAAAGEPRAASASTPAAVLEKYRSSAGGRARLDRLTSLFAEGTMYRTVLSPADARFVFRYRAPATFQTVEVRARMAEGPIICTIHGAEGWLRGVTPVRPDRDRIGWRRGQPLRDRWAALQRVAPVALGLSSTSATIAWSAACDCRSS